MTTSPSRSRWRSVGRAVVALVWVAALGLALHEALARIAWWKGDFAEREAARSRMLPDPDTLEVSVDAAWDRGEERDVARAVASRPRDPRLLAIVAGKTWKESEAEATRVALRAAEVAPYAGRIAAETGSVLLERGTARAREAIEWQERARRARESKETGADEVAVEARSRLVGARALLESIVALDRMIAPDARGRRPLSEQVAEAGRWLAELPEPSPLAGPR